jgi:two-component system, OmpR family, phosphate regulon response regulator PhoB
MATVLVVDDEVDLASLVDFNLKEAGFQTRLAHTGAAALEAAFATVPQLILLDVMLPDLSGREVCRRLKADPRTREVPVLMLTARGDEGDKIEGFEAGADDYVTKPFSVRELVYRVKAVLRRAMPATPEKPQLQVGKLRVDLAAHRCYVEGEEIALTALEFRLLEKLMSQEGRVLNRGVLLKDVWGLNSELETRTVDTHVMRLREKLGAARDQVETVRGVGYRLTRG